MSGMCFNADNKQNNINLDYAIPNCKNRIGTLNDPLVYAHEREKKRGVIDLNPLLPSGF